MAPSVVAKLNKTLNEIIADEKVGEHLVAAGVVVEGLHCRGIRAVPDGRIQAVGRCPRGCWHRATVVDPTIRYESALLLGGAKSDSISSYVDTVSESSGQFAVMHNVAGKKQQGFNRVIARVVAA
jgi:hypothetical protein